MADNVTADPGSGGATFGSDDIGGVQFPRIKLIIGADGTNDGDVSAANPLPVTGTVAITNAGLTELAAAINSNQVDVNIAASAATLTVASHAVTNAGTFATQVDGAALTALQIIDNPVLVDDAGFTPGSSSVMVAGFQADETSIDSVNEGDAGAARMTLDRKIITTPQPHTAGGLSIGRSVDLDETEEEITTSPGQIYGWNITNFATTTRFVRFYNATAANVTVGTTAPMFTLAIPGNATDDTMLAQSMGGMGIPFDTALCWAATTGLADNDTGAPGAADVAGTVWYK